ncbi:uncharacterized protein LOC106656551 [Trichogramma pretiosum]|uniref:uncharacterized protein LOC106656551 n=1 Tax=Trichogramma pretiosum TaxID=7493 RepID=UPI0006C98A6E|nr:uncharacterized protein LOC106656551 [Trichogramma pretiosum]
MERGRRFRDRVIMRIFSSFRGRVVCISPLEEQEVDGELCRTFAFDVENNAGLRIRCKTSQDLARRCARVIKWGTFVSMRNIFARSSRDWHLMGNHYEAVVDESSRLRYVGNV